MTKRIGNMLMGFAVALLLAACATATKPHPLVGNWEITIDTPIGAMTANLTVNPDLSGQMSSGDLGTAALAGVSVSGDAVSFNTTINAQGQSLTLAFAGNVVGDTLTGSFDTDFGAVAVSGRRL